jgi:P-type E1-E2 ATPase
VSQRRQIPNDATVEDFDNIAGSSVRASVDGRQVLVGAARLLERFNVPFGPLARESERLIEQAKTVILVAADGRAVGVIAAADVVRPNATKAIAELEALGIEAVMMTGDARRTAEAVAKQVGIERVFAEVLPGQSCRREAAPVGGEVHRDGRRRRQRRSCPCAS